MNPFVELSKIRRETVGKYRVSNYKLRVEYRLDIFSIRFSFNPTHFYWNAINFFTKYIKVNSNNVGINYKGKIFPIKTNNRFIV